MGVCFAGKSGMDPNRPVMQLRVFSLEAIGKALFPVICTLSLAGGWYVWSYASERKAAGWGKPA